MSILTDSKTSLWMGILSSFIIGTLTAISIRRLVRNTRLAYSGDENAAKRIILPCYKPLLYGISLLFILSGALQLVCALASEMEENNSNSSTLIIQQYGFVLLVIFCIPSMLMMQSSVSIAGFRRIAYYLGAYFIVCNIVWVTGLYVTKGATILVFDVIFFVLTFFPPFCASAGILSKNIQSRVQLGSASNRGSVELLCGYSIVYGIFNIVCVATQDLGSKSRSDEDPTDIQLINTAVCSILILVFGLFFPFALYRTLLADTKFWRGLGKHNQGGIRYSEQIMLGDLQAPTMDLSIVSSDLQDMITKIGDHLVIDFAFLKIKNKIGDGATAEVYVGKYKNKDLAIKISTPPEVTADVINVFASEASMSASVSSCPSIIKFHGICIRPPQIAMVVELCNGGDLKSSLLKHPNEWNVLRKLRACIDGARALEYVHSKGMIHRDVKAANFFVADGWKVKLGDFGEACMQQRAEDTTKENRMGILGTVSFMAPELIAAAIHYTEAVDVYAYAVMMWEIWSGGRDPFDDITTFKTYEVVSNGGRPDCTFFSTNVTNELIKQCIVDDSTMSSATAHASQAKHGPSNAVPGLPDVTNPLTNSCFIPQGALNIIDASWCQDASKRLTAKEMVNSLCELYHQLLLDAGLEQAAQEFLEEREHYESLDDMEDESARRSTFSSIKDMFTQSPMQEV